MHTLRPENGRLVAWLGAAAILTLVILMLLAARVGDISPASGSGAGGPPAATAAVPTRTAPAQRWLMSPFASPFQSRARGLGNVLISR